MKPCEEYRSAIVELVFEEPEDAQGLAVHEHLAGCAACRDEERRLLDLREAVRGPLAMPQAALRARMRAALPSTQAAGHPAWWRRPVPVWGVAAACTLIAALALALPRLGETWSGSGAGAPPPVANLMIPESVPPFAIAGSFDTGVCMTEPAESTRVVSPRPRDRDRDSL
jgi:anti-sigma factor RsiW